VVCRMVVVSSSEVLVVAPWVAGPRQSLLTMGAPLVMATPLNEAVEEWGT